MLNKIIAVLSPTLERRHFVEEIKRTEQILNEDTLTPYRDLVEAKMFQGNKPFKTGSVIKINSLVAKHMGNRTGANFVEVTAMVLSNMSAGFETFERIADHTIKGTVMDKVGLSYRKATLIQVLGLMDFVCSYSRMVLLYTLGKEVKNFKSEATMPEPFTKAEIKYLETHAENWARCLKIFSQPMVKIMATIDTVPDIVYDPNKEAAVLAQVGTRVDPLSLNYVPVVSDVIMFFGLRYVEKKALRYKKAEADRKALELRIAQYRAAATGNPDAVTDKLIIATEDELRAVNYEIAQMRKKMGLDE
ncbi:hypothetical protein SPLA10_PHROGS00029 [Salmonella phage SPLA10]|nr:hypothetical protein SPLA10_PHROGS00029 [Salmonella phage SPLA10]